MLKFKKYISERDMWLERWNSMAISYGLTEFMGEDVSPKTQLQLLQDELFPTIQKPMGIKDYLIKAGDLLGVEFNKEVRAGVSNRIGCPREWLDMSDEKRSEKFVSFLNSVLPQKTKIVGPNDIVDGVKNSSGSLTGFMVDFSSINPKIKKYVLVLAGIQKRSTGTTYQEAGFLFTLASSFKYDGENVFNINHWKSLVGTVKPSENKSYTEKQIDDIYNFCVSPDWKGSLMKAAGSVKKKLTIEPKLYIKDNAKFSVNLDAKRLYSNEGWSKGWDKDKLNPADVWLVYDSNFSTKVKSCGNLAELNSYLKQSVETPSGLVGLSLKKIKQDTKVKTVDVSKELKVVKSFEIVFGKLFTQGISQRLEMVVPDSTDEPDKVHSIAYRLFQNNPNELIRGEVEKKGTSASHGKIFLKYIDNVSGTTSIVKSVNKVRGDGSVEYDNKLGEYKLSKKGVARYFTVRAMYSKRVQRSSIVSIKQKDIYDKIFSAKGSGAISVFNEELNRYIENSKPLKGKSVTQILSKMNTRLNATFQNIVFAGWWAILYNKKLDKYNSANDVARKMLHFGMSMSEFSSVHLKIGG